MPSPSLIAARVAARYQNKKEVPKADGKGTTTVYEYGPRQVSNRNKAKAERVEKLRNSIGDLRAKYKKDLAAKDPQTRLTALAVALIDTTYERVGNDGSAKGSGHYGVTTWEADHVKLSGNKAVISYTGKSGVKHKKEVTDAKVVSALRQALKGKGKGERVLCEGDDCRIQATDVNAYLSDFDVTAKDIRGLHANEEMRRHLKEIRKGGPELPRDRKEKDKILKDEFKKALEKAAEAVGHEASTLKSQYLVPGLEDSYLHDGSVMEKLTKKAAIGRCYPWATKFAWGKPGAEIVHGTVYDEATGRRLGHAWVEWGGKVYDWQTVEFHQTLPMSIAAWRQKWKAREDYRMTDEEAAICSLRSRVHGPWTEAERAFMKSRRASEVVPEDRVEDLYDRYYKEAVRVASTVNLPRLARRLEGLGIDPWATTELPFGQTSFRAAFAASFASYYTDGEVKTRHPKWAEFVSRLATKSESEVEDEETERLVKPSPKKKPPRSDLQRRNVEERSDKADDPDEKQDKKDRSNNYKDAAARIARRFARKSPDMVSVTVRKGPEKGQTVQVTETTLRENPDRYQEIEEDAGAEEGDRKPSGEADEGPDVKKYTDAGMTEKEIDKVVEGIISQRREQGFSEDGDAEAVEEALDKAAETAKKKKVEEAEKKERKELLSGLSGSTARAVGGAIDDFDRAQLETFKKALAEEQTRLAQGGVPDDVDEFVDFAKKSRDVLGETYSERGRNLRNDPEKLAEALAAVTYYEGVVDSPTVETDPEVGPVPEGSDATTEVKDKGRLKEVQKAATRRAEKALDKYRDMEMEDRQRHYKKLEKEVKKLPANSERRLHLEAIQKGIGLASALEDEGKAQGVGGTIARLAKAAEKTGNVRRLLELGSVNSTEPGSPSDQQVLREVYSELTASEWKDVLGKDHPGAGLADLISNPERSSHLSDDDIEFIKDHLLDLVVAEAAFLDPFANRELGPDATVAEKQELTGRELKEAAGVFATGNKYPDVSKGGKKALDDMMNVGKQFLQGLAQKANSTVGQVFEKLTGPKKTPKKTPKKKAPKKTPKKAPEAPKEEAEDEHAPGTHWGEKGKWYAKDPDGKPGGPFKKRNEAKRWSRGEAHDAEGKAQAEKTRSEQQKAERRRKKRGETVLATPEWDFNPWPKLS